MLRTFARKTTSSVATAMTSTRPRGASSSVNGASSSSSVQTSLFRQHRRMAHVRECRPSHAVADPDVVPEPVPLLTSDESEDLLKIRHSTAHILAMATQIVYPKAQCTIGPWIDRGFYYDFYYVGRWVYRSRLEKNTKANV